MRADLRRDSARDLTERKRAELLELAERWQRLRSTYLTRYWDPRYAGALLRSRRRLAEEARDTWQSAELNVHLCKTALESALGVLRGNWLTTLTQARKRVTANPKLSQVERHWLRYVLKSPGLLQRCLDRETPHVTAEWAAELDERRLARRVRRLVMRSRGHPPRSRTGSWFEIDTNLYRPFARPEDRHFRGAWIALTGLRRGSRVCVPLAGRSLEEFAPRTDKPNSRPNLRVVVGERVSFHAAKRVNRTDREGTVEIGIDKGFRTLLTLSKGDPSTAESYGTTLGKLVSAFVDDSKDRRRRRQAIAAYERSIRTTDARKARRLRRRNLGSRRALRKSRSERARLRDEVNRTLNQVFGEHADMKKLHVEALDFDGHRIASRHVNRRLGRWLKGYLHRRLERKAELNGVEFNVVNAAYTSQTCPRCGFTARRNRNGERFQCADCGYTGSADAVAATNVLTRGSDTAIARFTSKYQVKHILDERWRTARTGRAWGSNDRGKLALALGDEPRTTSIPGMSWDHRSRA